MVSGWKTTWAGRGGRASCCAGLFLVAGLAGCQTVRPGGDPASLPAAGELQQRIEDKIATQRRPTDGSARWEEFRADTYQDTNDIERSTESIRLERQREEIARDLAKSGPLALDQCLVFGIEFNDAIQAKRADLRSIGGDELINRSRFLPHLTYALASQHAGRRDSGTAEQTATTDNATTTTAGSTNSTYHSLLLSQTLFEFGKDNALDVTLRDSQREALFGYEDTVRDVLANIRKRFFTIVLRTAQRAIREKSLAEFQSRHDQIRELEKVRRVLETDVLTARLNVLNEQGRINSLEKEILRQKLDLLHQMGFPSGVTQVDLAGSVESFGLTLDQASDLALRRSPQIARRRAAVAEQARKVRQLAWNYAPDVGLQAGWKNDRSMAGVGLAGTGGLYAASTFAEAHSDTYPNRFENPVTPLNEDDEGWFVNLSVELPLFEGLEKRGQSIREQGLLDRYRHELRAAIEGLTADVGAAYQTVLEQRLQVDILRETVQISRDRLRVQERLKELGKITDNELETFRTRYFDDQDAYFRQQIQLVEAQENLRYTMRYFEPLSDAAPKPDAPAP